MSEVKGDQCHAASGAHLRKFLRGNHRYVFTLIHKFQPERGSSRREEAKTSNGGDQSLVTSAATSGEVMPVLCDRPDVIVLTDEAHRSQYDTLALNMRAALIEFMPRVGELVQTFRDRVLDGTEARRFAEQAVLLRYPTLAEAPVEPETVLQACRPEDEGNDVWKMLNRVGENLTRGGVSDHRVDRRGRLCSVRALRGIDPKVTLNKALWGLAERVSNGEMLPAVNSVTLSA